MMKSCGTGITSSSSKRPFLVIFSLVGVLLLIINKNKFTMHTLFQLPTSEKDAIFSPTRNASMTSFTSQCKVGYLTSLPSPDLKAYYFTGPMGTSKVNDVIVSVLPVIAKYPLGYPCSCPRTLKVADFPMPTTALLSFPGSGNTWSRHLIEQLTGVHSGSIYFKTGLKAQGVFLYEGVTANMSVVKTHAPPDPIGLLRYNHSNANVTLDQIILLIRNPYAALMAEFKRGVMHLGSVRNGVIKHDSNKWTEFANYKSRRWVYFIRRSFAVSLPRLVVFYEDMTSSLFPEMVKMAAFLRTNYMSEFSLCCVLKKEQEGHYHRSPSNQTILDVFSPQQRTMMNRAISEAASGIQESQPDIAKRILEYVLL